MGLRVMEIPVRMRQTCMQRAGREPLPGFRFDQLASLERGVALGRHRYNARHGVRDSRGSA
jgi:hypothetical protein